MKILVIGESCTDLFVYGDVNRLAPAAPVPVFEVKESQSNMGMAGNVYNNLLAFNATADLCTNKNWKNVIKSRYVEWRSNYMFIRIDENDNIIKRINLKELPVLDQYDALIISDYCKGFLEPSDIQFISKRHPLVFLDTKKRLGDWCQNINFIKINGYEYAKTKDSLTKEILDKLIVTVGKDGCIFQGKKFSVPEVEVKDLSGAGDTFMAGLVFKYLKSGNIKESLIFANICATESVQKRGVSTCQNL